MRHLRSSDKSRNTIGATSLIAAFARQRRDLHKAIQVYRILCAEGMPPDSSVIGALIEAGRHCKQPAMVLPLLLDDIERFNVPLNHFDSTSIAHACGECKDAVSAKRLLARLEGSHHGWNVDDYLLVQH